MSLALATEYRAEAAEYANQATDELLAAWASISAADRLTTVATDLFDFLADLIDTYGVAVASLAADWYDELREVTGIPGNFTAEPVDLLDRRSIDSLVSFTVAPLQFDAQEALDRASQGLERRVLDMGRGTSMTAAIRDPQSRGWQRVGVGSCAFCLMLISRGAVYSKANANFGAHDGCKCAAVPAWSGEPVPVRPYEPSARTVSDADRARVRAWLAANT